MSEANAILYENEDVSLNGIGVSELLEENKKETKKNQQRNADLAGKKNQNRQNENMAEIASKQPTNADIMNCLSSIHDKLSKMEDKPDTQSES